MSSRTRSAPPAIEAYYAHWLTSPYANDYLEQMAEAAVDSFKLGNGKATDFLGISFSALDTAGHAYGPRSHEVQDVLVRLDAEIGKLLAFLDAKVGADNYVLALSCRSRCRDHPRAGARTPDRQDSSTGGRHRDGVEIECSATLRRRDDRLHGRLPAQGRLRRIHKDRRR